MSETEVAAPPKTTPAPTLLAGKYANEAELAKGIREAHKTIGLPPLPESQAIIGPGGLYADAKTAEEAYKQYDGVLSKVKTPAPTAPSIKTPTAIEPEGELGDDADLNAVLKSVGVQATELTEQWTKDGKLSDDQYAKFKAKGYPKSIINEHMKVAVRAAALEADQEIAKAVNIAGGQQQHDTIRQWAGNGGIPKEDLKELNEQFKTGKLSYSNYMRLIVSEHVKATNSGRTAPLVNGTSPQPSGPIKTTAEFNTLLKRAQAGDSAAIEQLRNAEFADTMRV